MVLRSKVWIRFLLLLTIFTISFISIDNRIAFNSQQQQVQNMIVTLNKIIGTPTQNKNLLPKPKSVRQFYEQLDNVSAKLDKLTVQQKQIQQKSLQQERILTALNQEIGAGEYPEDVQVEDELLSEQRIQQDQAEEKARIDQMMNNLEEFWQNDQESSGESIVSEASLLEGLSQAEDGTDVIEVGCKSNLCKLELQQTAEATLADNNKLDETLRDSTVYTLSFPNSDGSQRVIMYITQGETELTGISEQ